ncbi:MAG: acetamidase/formamidase family protein [Thermofilaceae archaeon]
MLTPTLRDGHEVNVPVAVEGARVGDAVVLRFESLRVLSKASSSGVDRPVDGAFVGDPYVAKRCPVCREPWPEFEVSGTGEEAVRCKRCGSPASPFRMVHGYTMVFDEARRVGLTVNRELARRIAEGAHLFIFSLKRSRLLRSRASGCSSSPSCRAPPLPRALGVKRGKKSRNGMKHPASSHSRAAATYAFSHPPLSWIKTALPSPRVNAMLPGLNPAIMNASRASVMLLNLKLTLNPSVQPGSVKKLRLQAVVHIPSPSQRQTGVRNKYMHSISLTGASTGPSKQNPQTPLRLGGQEGFGGGRTRRQQDTIAALERHWKRMDAKAGFPPRARLATGGILEAQSFNQPVTLPSPTLRPKKAGPPCRGVPVKQL